MPWPSFIHLIVANGGVCSLREGWRDINLFGELKGKADYYLFIWLYTLINEGIISFRIDESGILVCFSLLAG